MFHHFISMCRRQGWDQGEASETPVVQSLRKSSLSGVRELTVYTGAIFRPDGEDCTSTHYLKILTFGLNVKTEALDCSSLQGEGAVFYVWRKE